MKSSPLTAARCGRAWIGGLLLFLAAHAQAQDASSEAARAAVERAHLSLLREDFAAAARDFEQSYNWSPNFDAALGAGMSHFKQHHFAEAELWFANAQRFRPSDQQSAILLASAQMANRKFSEALDTLQSFVRNYPDSSQQAGKALADLRADLDARRPRWNTRKEFSARWVPAVLAVLSFGGFLVLLRAENPGLRQVGKGLGLLALASFAILGPFPLWIWPAGLLWGGYQFVQGVRLYRRNASQPRTETNHTSENDFRRHRNPPRDYATRNSADTPAAGDNNPLAGEYALLGIRSAAGYREVRSAFRRQARQFHPDRIPASQPEQVRLAAESFRRIRSAYRTICEARGWR